MLVVQFVPGLRGRPAPRFEPELGVLLALLRDFGHQVDLVGVSRFELSPVKAALARFLPHLICADISPVCADLARRVLQHVQEKEFLPVVATGRLATLEPALCLSLPGVQAAVIGEADAPLVAYFERLKDPSIGQVVQGIWLRDERGTARPQLPSLVEDLDSLPFAERALFGYADRVARFGEAEIAVGRGCPQVCGYCSNPTRAALYAGRGSWVRRRSPERIIEEIAEIRRNFPGVRRIRFLDHAFALDADWLTGFLQSFRAANPLPFRCHLRANAVSDTLTARLADAGCEAADVELISGSDFIRNEIFAMQLDEERLRAAFDALRAAQIASRAVVYCGSPYDTPAALDETRALLRALRPDWVDVRPYYPFPGTPARATALENGWLHRRAEDQYHHDECGIDMPACRPEAVAAFVRRLRAEFSVRWAEPWWRRWWPASRRRVTALFDRRS